MAELGIGLDLIIVLAAAIAGGILAHRLRLPVILGYLVAGIAMARAIEESTGVAVRLKWPNDIIAADRKVGGVLVESEVRGGRVVWAVVGSGVNVNGSRDDFPEGLRPVVTTLAEQAGRPLSRITLCQRFLEQLESAYGRFTSKGLTVVLAEWRTLAWSRMEAVGGGQG